MEDNKKKFEDIMNELAIFKRKHRNVITNYIPGAMRQDIPYDVARKDEKGIVVVAHEPYRLKGYFVAENRESLVALIRYLPENIVFEWIFQKENDLDEAMKNAGISLYATYIRRTRVYKKNPYEIPETGKRALLHKLYDPSCGEYACVEDAEELRELSCSVFDKVCDDIFTIDEWRTFIKRKEVLIYRGKGKILACYVWHVEGKKLYGNISINISSADILYNMERRIFEEMWNRGIRVFYSWKNMKNEKAIRREIAVDEDILASESILYDAIYKT